LKAKVPDELIVREYISGNHKAFDDIVSRYKTRLFHWILKFIGEPGRAEELTQECFLRVYRHIHEFDMNRSFQTWIYRIAVNLAKNELRDRNRRPESRIVVSFLQSEQAEGPAIDTPAPATSRPDICAEEDELVRRVQKAMQLMPMKFKEVLLLRELEEMSYDDIASVLQRPIGTVRSRVNRAREWLGKFIEAESNSEHTEDIS